MIEFACAQTPMGLWRIFYGPSSASGDFAQLCCSFESLRDGVQEAVLSLGEYAPGHFSSEGH